MESESKIPPTPEQSREDVETRGWKTMEAVVGESRRIIAIRGEACRVCVGPTREFVWYAAMQMAMQHSREHAES